MGVELSVIVAVALVIAFFFPGGGGYFVQLCFVLLAIFSGLGYFHSLILAQHSRFQRVI